MSSMVIWMGLPLASVHPALFGSDTPSVGVRSLNDPPVTAGVGVAVGTVPFGDPVSEGSVTSVLEHPKKRAKPRRKTATVDVTEARDILMEFSPFLKDTYF
jgi:hypothetical protein